MKISPNSNSFQAAVQVNTLTAIRETWRMPVIRFEGNVPVQALAPDRTRALALAGLYVVIAGGIVLAMLATRPNGML